MKMADLTGNKYGRLIVIERDVSRRSRGITYWFCQCSCGRVKSIYSGSLKRGLTKSCGCLSAEIAGKRPQTHGATRSKERPLLDEYALWRAMKSRCQSPTNIGYPSYGGRGIKVCERWCESFCDFMADMGPRPEGYTLDRIDNDGDYEPSNCRWTTRKQQARNTRKNRLVSFNGETLCISEWAERTGLPASLIGDRLRKHKWSVERALTTVPGSKRKPQRNKS